ncbi:uncharacterized protein LOC132276535 [Cornus florida]|uniref:uncharacterized protein LOC132276535 n=1 Tax=Cornus florida TaxID=4283 RepID=UPI00289E06CA|nr:uncharacterized protein LOC132276535 [Cornus florida]
MASWSAENATKAYLQTLKMGKGENEPDAAEFISALAAGNNKKLMVTACAGTAGSIILALVAAAHQTGGRVVCILPGPNELQASQSALGHHARCIEFVVGDAETLLSKDYKSGDFILVDCNINNLKGVLVVAQRAVSHGGALVVGYNARHEGSWLSELKAQFLPIGEGLMVAKTAAGRRIGGGGEKKSHWVVEIDKHTGEEHFFRITSP